MAGSKGIGPGGRTTFRDEALQAEFARRGYVRVSLLSPAEVSSLRDEIQAMKPGDGFAPDAGKWRNVTYHCSFLDSNREYRRRVYDLVVATLEKPLYQLLYDYKVLQGNLYVKPPGRGKFGLHQNWPAVTDLDDVTVSVWCALGDLTAENGPISLIAGSHKLLPHVQGPANPFFGKGLEETLYRDGYVESLTLHAGEAVVFDDGLIHGSPPNRTTEPRIGVQAICAPADAVPAYYLQAGADMFEIVRADAEFWLNNDVDDLLQRREDWESLGFVRNQNRPVMLEELAALIANGEEVRRGSIALEPVPPSAPRKRNEPLHGVRRPLGNR